MSDKPLEELAFQVASTGGRVHLTFPRPLTLLDLSPQAACQMGQMLIIQGHRAQADVAVALAHEQGEADLSTKH